jgi:hypothetical protein
MLEYVAGAIRGFVHENNAGLAVLNAADSAK